ncbi:MAG: Uma2 family endonuclease [Thermosynechococcaceae cyanobacterium]
MDTINISNLVELTDEQFEQLCRNNRDVRIEQSADGHLLIMPPTGWETGNRNSELTYRHLQHIISDLIYNSK